MRRRFADYLVITAGVLALLYMVSVSARAQQTNGPVSAPGYGRKAPSKPLPEGGPTPRLADGHADFSGVWFQGLLGKEDATLVGSFGALDPAQRTFDPKVTPQEDPSFQPWAAAKIPHQPARAALDQLTYDRLPKDQKLPVLDLEILRLSRNCMPHGVPGIVLGADRPFQFVSTPGLLVQ
jgi:hypothetical protein